MRIEELYNDTNGKCILSFSGGKDSTVLAELYLMAKERGVVDYIPLVFADTQVEYNAIYDFVEWFNNNKQEVIYLKPRKPFSQVLKEYGKPAMSKVKSGFINTYQNILNREEDPMTYKRTSELISGYQMGKNFTPQIENGEPKSSRQRLANKHFNFLHPDHETRVSDACCSFLKKYPFDDYYIEKDINGYMTGMRKGEGGVRQEMYKSCTAFKKVGKKNVIHKMPLFYWKDKHIEEFIKKYNIKISKAYTEYGLDRTGCVGCPFAKDITTNLKVLHDYEPSKYKAIKNWLGDVYLDLLIEIPFDEEYTKKLEKRKPIVEQRRYEMLKKYRPNIAEKWKTKTKQYDIWEGENYEKEF